VPSQALHDSFTPMDQTSNHGFGASPTNGATTLGRRQMTDGLGENRAVKCRALFF
jgi:hypothetical protein